MSLLVKVASKPISVPDDVYISLRWANAYQKPITYFLTNNELTKKKISNMGHFREIITSAFNYWQRNSQLRFLEVSEEEVAEIKISFEESGKMHGKCPSKFEPVKDGDYTKVYAHANYPPPENETSSELLDEQGRPSKVVRYRDTIHGDLHFNSDIVWSTDVVKIIREDNDALIDYIENNGHDKISIAGLGTNSSTNSSATSLENRE